MNFTNSQMVTRLGSSQILIFGGAVAALSGIFLVALFAMPSLPPFWSVYAAQSVYAAMVGLIVANSLAGAMNVDPQSAGSISSLVGAMHYGAGIIGASLVGLLHNGTPRPVMWLILLFGGLAWLLGSRAAAIVRTA